MRVAASTPARRIRVRRYPERARYERAALDPILDAGLLCHVGFVFEGSPVVIPTLYWRDANHLYWHGSTASRMLRAVPGSKVCITVTHLDGLVLTRSAFHHSVNTTTSSGATLANTSPRVDWSMKCGFTSRIFNCWPPATKSYCAISPR